MALQFAPATPAMSLGKTALDPSHYGGTGQPSLEDIVSGLSNELSHLIEDHAAQVKRQNGAAMEATQGKVGQKKSALQTGTDDANARDDAARYSQLKDFLSKILSDGKISPDELAMLLKMLGMSNDESADGSSAGAGAPAVAAPSGGGGSGVGGASGGSNAGKSGGATRSRQPAGNVEPNAQPNAAESTFPAASSAAAGKGGGQAQDGPESGSSDTVGPANPASGREAAGTPATTDAPAAIAQAGHSTDPLFGGVGGPASTVMLGNTKVTVQGGTPDQRTQTTGLMKQIYDKDPEFKQGIDSKAATGIDVTIKDLPGNDAGYATVAGNQISFDPQYMGQGGFAHTIGHEIAHNLGMNHGAALDAFADRAAASVA